MAYALRYYKEIPQEDGSIIRLEIHKKDSTTAALEIGGVLRGLTLEIQGQQDEIDSPIVKTSLSMSFVDASDIQNDKKNGFWQEFYTPDALLWRVILKAKNAQETAFRTIWGGYVTPDSYSETLNYRGSVTIIARDNIGHLQDFPFDAQGDEDGMISLFDLVSAGWEKIQSPMDLLWNGLDWLSCNDVIAYDTLMNVEHFKDMDWYTAIEEALASYGGVMRYVGGNEVIVTTLRKMPHYGGNIDKLPHIEPVFVTGATRELIPAAKRIEESASYDLQDAVQPLVKVSDFSGNVHDASMGGFTAPVWSLTNQSKSGWSNTIPANAMYFNASAYEIQETPFLPAYEISKKEIQESMWLLCDGNNARAEYSRVVNPVDLSIKLQLGETINLYGGVPTGQDLFIVNAPVKVYRIKYAIAVESDGITSYLDAEGKWSATLTELEAYDSGNDIRSLEVLVPMSEYGHNVLLTLIVTGIETSGGGLEETYIQVQSLAFGLAETKAYCEKNVVNTNYAQENNVTLFRDPKIAPALNVVALPAFIKNGIFYRNGDEILPARLWSWGGSEQQMAVWNHLQLLCYYAKPNNLISGTIVNADITRVAAIYEWNHAEHILVSGRYNFLNGHIEGAVLREFARYEDMWSEVAGAAMPETEQDSRSNVEGGASSSASPSTYTATQNVNIGTGGGGGTGASQLNDLTDVNIEGVVAQSVLYYNGTSWVDMNFASLVNPFLNPYLKSETAKATYATIEALNGLGATVSANTSAITGLGTRMTNAENEIGLRYTKQETNNLLAKYLLLESANQTIKGNITIEGNLVVTGDTSSGAKGTDGGVAGTLLGIKVNGTTYDKPVNGILTIPDYPTSLAWSAIEGKPTKLSQFTNDAGFITSAALSGYAKKTDIPTSLPASDVYEWAKAAKKPSYKTSEVAEETNLYFTNTRAVAALADTLKGYVTNDALASDLKEYASKEWVNEKGYITGITITGDDYISANGYKLSLAIDAQGGLANTGQGLGVNNLRYSLKFGNKTYDGSAEKTITAADLGALTAHQTIYGLTIKNSAGTQVLSFTPTSANGELTLTKAMVGLGNVENKSSATIRGEITATNVTNALGYTPANNASLADYLPKSGGTIDGTTSSPLKINTSSATIGIPLSVSNSEKAWFGWSAGQGVYLWNATANKYLGIKEDGTPHYNGSALIHSGNIGSQKVAGLATPVTIWGQSFDGTGNVNGNINGDVTDFQVNAYDGSARYNIIDADSNNAVLYFGYGSAPKSYKTRIAGESVVLHYGTSKTTGLILNSSGNVTISGSDLAGTSTKLYVNGTARISGAVTMSNELFLGNNMGIYFKNASGTNVLAMYVNPSNVLQVGYNNVDSVAFQKPVTMSSTLTVNGNAVVKGDTSSGSDIRFKDKLSDHRIALSDIADAPLFTFKWNDREDDTIHLGSSAQYWEKVAPWLVKGEDFKTLDYSTLGVAIGISLANKAVNHEERIKILEEENKALKAEIRRIQHGS